MSFEKRKRAKQRKNRRFLIKNRMEKPFLIKNEKSAAFFWFAADARTF